MPDAAGEFGEVATDRPRTTNDEITLEHTVLQQSFEFLAPIQLKRSLNP